MATAAMKKEMPKVSWSQARLRRHLGMIPTERILLIPYPGSATAADVLSQDDHHHVICELVDGVLVRKPMGAEESMLAMLIGHFLLMFVRKHDLGIVLGEAGFLELAEANPSTRCLVHFLGSSPRSPAAQEADTKPDSRPGRGSVKRDQHGE